MNDSIYTRAGDDGSTSLVGGARVPKNSVRVTAYGAIDEANSHVGLARAALSVDEPEQSTLDEMLEFVQQRLFNCSSRTATPDNEINEHTPSVRPDDTAALENYIDMLLARPGMEMSFVLPGGTESSARLHVARTVVRRAERNLLDLATDETVDADVLAFVNRLSDLLFVMARRANALSGGLETVWDPNL